MPRKKTSTALPSGTKAELTDKQRLFVLEYLQSWNATDAARKAGYADPEQAGYENKRKQEIQAEISRHLDERAMPANEVLARLAEHARGSLGEFIGTDETGKPNRFSLASDKPLHLVKKVSVTDKGWSFEMYDAQAALVHIGKHHGLFVDKSEITGKDGGPIETTNSKLEQAARELTEWREQMTKQLSGQSAPPIPPTPATPTE